LNPEINSVIGLSSLPRKKEGEMKTAIAFWVLMLGLSPTIPAQNYESWTSFNNGFPTNTQLNAVFYTKLGPPASSIYRGYIAGANGGLAKTTTLSSSGGTWAMQSTPTTQGLYGIHFTDTSNGWVVGDAGVILKTVNAGNNYTTQTSGTSRHLSSVYFANTTTGLAVGDSGTVLRTTNGGTTWASMAAGIAANLNAVQFTNITTAYIAGNGGLILKTINGGVGWTPLASGTTAHLRSIFFTDTNNGYAAGYGGVILKTSNAGASWSAQTSGTRANLRSIHFSFYGYGLAGGDSGVVLRTYNGGSTWYLGTAGFTRTDINFLSVYEAGGAGGPYPSGLAVGTLSTSIVGHIPLPILAQRPSTGFLEFNRDGHIAAYHLTRPTRVSIRLLDIRGKMQLQLSDEIMDAGNHAFRLPKTNASPLILDFQAGNFRKLTPL
jgi:photosystem II stability/assembly factor-like uncharacterized protein